MALQTKLLFSILTAQCVTTVRRRLGLSRAEQDTQVSNEAVLRREGGGSGREDVDEGRWRGWNVGKGGKGGEGEGRGTGTEGERGDREGKAEARITGILGMRCMVWERHGRTACRATRDEEYGYGLMHKGAAEP